MPLSFSKQVIYSKAEYEWGGQHLSKKLFKTMEIITKELQASKVGPQMPPCENAEKKKAQTATLGGHLPDLGRHWCNDCSLEGFQKAAFTT